MQQTSVKKESRPPKFYGDRRFIDQVTLGTETSELVDSDDEPLVIFSGSKSLQTQTTYPSASPSDYLTPIEDIPWHPTLVAETTQGSSSTPTSLTPKIAKILPPLVEVSTDIQNDHGSDISSGIDTDVRREADCFHDRFNATY